MNQYLKNLTSVLEVLIMKSIAQDKPLNGLPDPEAIPVYDIFDQDIPNEVWNAFNSLVENGYSDNLLKN